MCMGKRCLLEFDTLSQQEICITQCETKDEEFEGDKTRTDHIKACSM